MPSPSLPCSGAQLQQMLATYRDSWQAQRPHTSFSLLGRVFSHCGLFEHSAAVIAYRGQRAVRNQAKLDAFLHAMTGHSVLQERVHLRMEAQLALFQGKRTLRGSTLEATLRAEATALALQQLGVVPLERFDLASSQAVGGVSGSKKVRQYRFKRVPPLPQAQQPQQAQQVQQVQQVTRDVQLKDTNLDRIKVGWHDAPNYAELICARLMTVLLTPPAAGKSPKRVPRVQQVYDAGRHSLMLGSPYLKNVQCSLEQFARAHTGYAGQQRMQISLAAAPPDAPAGGLCWYMGGNPTYDWLRADLEDILAARAIVGDHDVNPGNMIVVHELGRFRLKPIDFGHGLNSLIRHSAIVPGGGLQYQDNRLVDYFCRSTVLHLFAKQRVSKLRRFYDGLEQSPTLQRRLQAMAVHQPALKAELGQLRQYFTDMLAALMLDPVQNRALIAKSLHTLHVLAQRLGGTQAFRPYAGEDLVQVTARIDGVFAQFGTFFDQQFEHLAALKDQDLYQQARRVQQDDGALRHYA